MLVARDLRPYEVWLVESLCLAAKFHFGHHKPIIGTMKLVHFEYVVATMHYIAVLVYHAASAQSRQKGSFIERNLFLKLVACQTAIAASALNGEICLVVAHSHPHRSTIGRNIPLLYMTHRRSLTLVRSAMLYQKLAFYFQSTHNKKGDPRGRLINIYY